MTTCNVEEVTRSAAPTENNHHQPPMLLHEIHFLASVAR